MEHGQSSSIMDRWYVYGSPLWTADFSYSSRIVKHDIIYVALTMGHKNGSWKTVSTMSRNHEPSLMRLDHWFWMWIIDVAHMIAHRQCGFCTYGRGPWIHKHQGRTNNARNLLGRFNVLHWSFPCFLRVHHDVWFERNGINTDEVDLSSSCVLAPAVVNSCQQLTWAVFLWGDVRARMTWYRKCRLEDEFRAFVPWWGWKRVERRVGGAHALNCRK